MDLESLRVSPVGQLVPITGHDERLQEYNYFAFVPEPLPDAVLLDGPTWNKVADASEALGRLRQACATLPNPRLLIAPALAREAVDTSALEGTYGAVADVLEARLADVAPKSAEVAEIRAYERIAHKAFDWVRERPVTMAMLSDLQGELAAESTNPSRDPGRIRERQVVIGPKGGTIYDARYIHHRRTIALRAGSSIGKTGWSVTSRCRRPCGRRWRIISSSRSTPSATATVGSVASLSRSSSCARASCLSLP